MASTQHIGDKEIIITISIDICEIDAHRGHAHVAARQWRRRPKISVAVIQPNAIARKEKIIANINVGGTIAVKIAKHY